MMTAVSSLAGTSEYIWSSRSGIPAIAKTRRLVPKRRLRLAFPGECFALLPSRIICLSGGRHVMIANAFSVYSNNLFTCK